MDLRPYIDEIHHQLEVAAETGGEAARALAERLIAPLDAAVRLSLLDALAAAAAGDHVRAGARFGGGAPAWPRPRVRGDCSNRACRR